MYRDFPVLKPGLNTVSRFGNMTGTTIERTDVGSSPTVTTRAEAVENQRLLLLGLHPGVHCPGVVFVGVNGSDNPNCQNCRLA